MNILTLKKLAAALVVASSLILANAAHAGLMLNSPGVVGVWDDKTDAAPATRLNAAQTLLDMAKDTGTLYTDIFVTSSTEYSGTLSGGSKIDGGIDLWGSVTGYDWGFIKYNGKNAGYVLFYLGGVQADTLIPAFPADLWTTKPDQYEVSGITFYNRTTTSVPDSASTLVLIGLGLSGLSFAARRRQA